MSDAAFQRVLDRYNKRAEEEMDLWRSGSGEDLFARRDEFLLHVGAEVAEFLRSLIVARGATRIVELGTSYGYSTLFLADAARRTGGRLYTFELAEAKQAHARRELEEAGLSDHVEWKLGDAVELLGEMESGIDFVLIDLWKDLYIPCLEALYPKLAEQALIAADNMLQPEASRPHADAYRARVRTFEDLQTVLLPIGQGVELSCLWRRPPG